ncbi:MAG TPA: type II toxin-antitoxin system VapB family antitoxin [Candidatus Manganitrophaceae bacterium]
MRTTLNLDEDLIQELIKATEARTKTEAIHIAAEELIRRKKLEKLKSLSGKIHIDLDRRKREKVESARQKRLARGWRGHR